MRARAVIPSLLSLLILGGGCGEDAGVREEPPVTRFPVAGCESFDTAPCDVLTTDCQIRLLGLAACMRGSAPGQPLPTITRMTEAQYAQVLMTRFAAVEPRPDPDHAERALVMLGLVETGAFRPSAMAATRAQSIRGEYRFDTDEILLVDRGQPADDIEVNGTLLHEFVHALQDRDTDLATWYDGRATSFDSRLAASSVVEGEARMHQVRFGASSLGLDPGMVDWRRRFDNVAASAERWVVDHPSPYLASYSAFPYEYGARLLYPRFAAFGHQAVTDIFASPPSSTHILMVAPGVTPTPAGPALTPPTAPPDWNLLYADTLGAWGLLLVLTNVTPLEAARPEALRWRGDQLWIYGGTGSATPATAAVWRLMFLDEADATLVFPFLTAVPQLRVQQYGRQITVLVSDSSLPFDWAFVPPSPA